MAILCDMDWMPLSIEREAYLPNTTRLRPNIPYILPRVLELNKLCENAVSVILVPRDLGIPSILVYTEHEIIKCQFKVQLETRYSKVTIVENLDEADIWMDASERLLRVAFAQILPFFRLVLQLDPEGILEIYIGPQNLMEFDSLENSPGLSPGDVWYSFSKRGCFVCDDAEIFSKKRTLGNWCPTSRQYYLWDAMQSRFFLAILPLY
ncbi:hypothetical protein M413DRAFT_27237 [Hebeloma cylindrosporum]|uniref:Uncharacterized protein n=1 Tax=Hebeloma cylindrosporum TaxID=76867 RepID=A0A0C3CE56_HEBCY|nr:hypothetical protein M413DRAFT_27237 [Hebeloma cylindrosporum h7]